MDHETVLLIHCTHFPTKVERQLDGAVEARGGVLWRVVSSVFTATDDFEDDDDVHESIKAASRYAAEKGFQYWRVSSLGKPLHGLPTYDGNNKVEVTR